MDRFMPLALLWVLLFSGLVGCLRRPAVELIPEAEMKILEARQVNAEKYAPEDLKRAEENLAKARTAYAEALLDRARRLAEAALVDAEYAAVAAQNKRAQQHLSLSAQQINRLKK